MNIFRRMVQLYWSNSCWGRVWADAVRTTHNSVIVDRREFGEVGWTSRSVDTAADNAAESESESAVANAKVQTASIGSGSELIAIIKRERLGRSLRSCDDSNRRECDGKGDDFLHFGTFTFIVRQDVE